MQGTGVVTEIGRGLVTSHGSFVHARDGRGVVSSIGNGGIADVALLSHESSLGQDAGLLQVAVGDLARWVVKGNQGVLDVGRKGKAPQEGLSCAVVEDTAHTCFGGISSAQKCGFLGHYFSEVCRPRA